MLTVEILDALNGMTESPWGYLHGKPLDARNLSRRLLKYGVTRATIRIGDVVGKGYRREDLFDPWSRYVTAVEDGGVLDTDPKPESLLGKGAEAQVLPVSPVGPVTSVTSVTGNGVLGTVPARWPDGSPYQLGARP
jgi:hypothetical protein